MIIPVMIPIKLSIMNKNLFDSLFLLCSKGSQKFKRCGRALVQLFESFRRSLISLLMWIWDGFYLKGKKIHTVWLNSKQNKRSISLSKVAPLKVGERKRIFFMRDKQTINLWIPKRKHKQYILQNFDSICYQKKQT